MSVAEKLKRKYEKKGGIADTLPRNGFFVHLDTPMKRPEDGKITENLTAAKEDKSGYIHIYAEKGTPPLAAINSHVGKPAHSTILFYDCEKNKKWLPELIKYLDGLEP